MIRIVEDRSSLHLWFTLCVSDVEFSCSSALYTSIHLMVTHQKWSSLWFTTIHTHTLTYKFSHGSYGRVSTSDTVKDVLVAGLTEQICRLQKRRGILLQQSFKLISVELTALNVHSIQLPFSDGVGWAVLSSVL